MSVAADAAFSVMTIGPKSCGRVGKSKTKSALSFVVVVCSCCCSCLVLVVVVDCFLGTLFAFVAAATESLSVEPLTEPSTARDD